MPQPDRYVSIHVVCSQGHEHPLCIEIPHQVPPDLRCAPNAGPGYITGGGSCTIPPIAELATRAQQELRDNFQESKRQGYVLLRRE